MLNMRELSKALRNGTPEGAVGGGGMMAQGIAALSGNPAPTGASAQPAPTGGGLMAQGIRAMTGLNAKSV